MADHARLVLRLLRQGHGWTQRQLEVRMGVKPGTVSRYEREKDPAKLTFEILEPFLKGLGVSVSQFMKLVEDLQQAITERSVYPLQEQARLPFPEVRERSPIESALDWSQPGLARVDHAVRTIHGDLSYLMHAVTRLTVERLLQGDAQPELPQAKHRR